MEDIYRSNPRVDEKNKCASFNGMFRSGERKKLDCLREMKGKYATIVKEPPEPLELCQVQVVGYSFQGNRFLLCMFSDFIMLWPQLMFLSPPPPPKKNNNKKHTITNKHTHTKTQQQTNTFLCCCFSPMKVRDVCSPHENYGVAIFSMRITGCNASPWENPISMRNTGCCMFLHEKYGVAISVHKKYGVVIFLHDKYGVAISLH